MPGTPQGAFTHGTKEALFVAIFKQQQQKRKYHSSIICSSRKVEATQVSTDRWMDKENVAYTYNVILLTLKKQILTQPTTRMKLKNILLSEIN